MIGHKGKRIIDLMPHLDRDVLQTERNAKTEREDSGNAHCIYRNENGNSKAINAELGHLRNLWELRSGSHCQR